MNVLTLVPPSLPSDNVIRDVIYGCWCKGKRIGGATSQPQPLVSVATVLREEGHTVEVIDAPAQGLTFREVARRISEFDAVIVLTSVMAFKEDAAVIRRLKEYAPGLVAIVGGALPTFMPEFCLKDDAVDFIVAGEGEFSFRDLVGALGAGDGKWKEVPGIGYQENGAIHINPPYPLIQNLDEIPITDWSLLPPDSRYFYPLVRRYPFVADLTTRGCPKRCIFCMAPPFYGNKVRGRSADHVIRGWEHYASQGVKEIYLRDEMFTTLKRRNTEICNYLINHNVNLTWLCSAAIGWMDKEMMALMKRAGCHTLKIGVESGVQEILDTIKKEITLDMTRDTFRWAKEAGVKTHAHVMIGHPGETKETIMETVRFVKEIDPDTATFGIFTPYPGTEPFEWVKARHPEVNENFSIDLKTLHQESFYTHLFCDLSAEELAYYEKKVHRLFYWRPAYLWKMIKQINTFDDLKRTLRAGLNVLDFSVRGDT